MIRAFGMCLIAGVAGGVAVWIGQGHSLSIISNQISYADLAMIMLAAAGVILTALAIVIGILALWGYSQFKTMTEEAAVSHVRKSISDGELLELVTRTSSNVIDKELVQGRLRKLLEERVDEILLKGPAAREDEDKQPDTTFEEGASDDESGMA